MSVIDLGSCMSWTGIVLNNTTYNWMWKIWKKDDLCLCTDNNEWDKGHKIALKFFKWWHCFLKQMTRKCSYHRKMLIRCHKCTHGKNSRNCSSLDISVEFGLLWFLSALEKALSNFDEWVNDDLEIFPWLKTLIFDMMWFAGITLM